MGVTHAHSHSEKDGQLKQQAVTTNPDALPRGFPCSLQSDLLQWNEQVIQKDQFGKWKLILLNAEKFHAGNVAILKRGKDVVLIDSGCAKNHEKLVKKITKQDYAPFFLVNTHAHPDHTGANNEMVEEDAIVLAHRNAREHMVRDPDLKESGLPVVTFGRSMSIYAGDQRMRLIGLAPGHTDGDLAVWVPDLNILHTGDIFMSSDYPMIDARSGGTILGLIRSINRVVRISDKDTVVIPGHGDLAGRKQLVQYQKMLRNVSEDVREYKDKGLDVEAVKDLDLTKKYDKKWGQGDLISGRQFVGFVYNTLPEQKASSSKRLVSSNSFKEQDIENDDAEFIGLFSKQATLVLGDEGQALLSLDLKQIVDKTLDSVGIDGLTGMPLRDHSSGKDLIDSVDLCSQVQLGFGLKKATPEESSDVLEGRLEGVNVRKNVVELQFVFDAADLTDKHYLGLAQNESIELEDVRIVQAYASSEAVV